VSSPSTPLAPALSPDELSRLLSERIRRRGQGDGRRHGLLPRDRSTPAPLSFAQRRLWLLQRQHPGGCAYNVPFLLHLEGVLATAWLDAALAAVVRRHEVLRTRYRVVGGEPVQEVAPPAPPGLPLVDLAGLPAAARPRAARRLAERAARRPFDLARDLPLRVTLFRLAPRRHQLLLNVHHVAFDGWSRGVLIEELSALYAAAAHGAPPELAEPALQYQDFAEWQRRQGEEGRAAEQLSFWRRQLAPLPPPLELPPDRPRPAGRDERGAVASLPVSADLLAAAADLGSRHEGTPFMVLLAAFAALLYRYTGRRRLHVATPVANRRPRELEPLIGFFVNTLVLPAEVAPSLSFGALLTRVRSTVLAAFAHQDLPFERLVEELAEVRDPARHPLGQVAFAATPWGAPPAALAPGLACAIEEVGTGTCKFDFSLSLEEGPAGTSLAAEYATALYDDTTARRLLGHFRHLLAAAVAAPGCPVADLPLLAAAERHQLLREWRAGRPSGEVEVLLLDRRGGMVPIGVAGEIRLGGAGLSRGTRGGPAWTAERFLPDPFAGSPGGRLARSGERARQLPDGTLVPLAEALPGPLGAPRERRPRPSSGTPQSLLEQRIAATWAEALGVEGVGPGDDFWELGGHSLLADRVLLRLEEALGVELPPTSLLEASSLSRFAEAVRRALPPAARELVDHTPLSAAEIRALAGAPPAPLPPPGTVRDREQPLSSAQARLWFLDRLEPGTAVYNLPIAPRLTGPLAVATLAAAWEEVLRRHQVLRARFGSRAGEPYQRAAPPAAVELPVVDLGGLPWEHRRGMAERLARSEAGRPFDLAGGALLRLALVRLSGDRHRHLVTLHHAVGDGRSLELLVGELATLYEAFAARRPSPLPEPPAQYADYAAGERRRLAAGAFGDQLVYWRHQLAAVPAVLDLPTDRPRPAQPSHRGGVVSFRLDPDLGRELQRLGRRQGATPFMVLVAAFQLLLGRYAAQTRLALGTPVANRRHASLEGLVGLLVNTLVLPADLTGSPSFAQLLARTRQAVIGALSHQDLPFERLVEELAPGRQRSRSPLFQASFALHNPEASQRMLGPDLQLDLEEVHSGTAKFDLALFMEEGAGGFAGAFEYACDLFDATSVRRLAKHFAALLGAAAAAPGGAALELGLLTAAERQQTLVEWNDTASRYARESSVPALLRDRSRQRGEAVALVAGGEHLSYGALEAWANRLAHHLLGVGVKPEEPVALALGRSPELVAALLGILAAGGAYLPLDLSYPADRLALMMEDAGARVLVTREALLAAAGGEDPASGTVPPAVAAAARRLVLLDRDAAAIAAADPAPPARAVAAGQLAYVDYTSGSTGRPKGVPADHRGVVRLVDGAGYARFGPGQTFLQLAPIAFDASTLEIWGPLLHGGRLVLAPPHAVGLAELARLVERHRITTLWLTSGLFVQMAAEQLPALDGVGQLLTGGEVMKPAAAAAYLARRRALGWGTLIHCYGPTEGTTFTTTVAMAPRWRLAAGAVPIGRPIANARVYVHDPGGRPVPAGVPGELVLGGDGLARGYLGRPGLTAERFVPDGTSGRPGERLYRSGDRVRHLAGGLLDFLGRFDHQVKLRGFRIELGEVEAHLQGHPAVAAAVAVMREEPAGERRLVAYVEAAAGEVPGAGELRRALAAALPSYMVPAAFVVLSALPRTPSGKVDRRSLPAPEEPVSERPFAPPRTELERELAAIWAQALGVEQVGLDDDFWELGGHSLLATKVTARVEDLLGIEMPLASLFHAPRLGEFVAAIGEALLAEDPGDGGGAAADAQLTPAEVEALLAGEGEGGPAAGGGGGAPEGRS
jgi:amino acid adenylation domain-containing protein